MDFNRRQNIFVEAVQRKAGAGNDWRLTKLFGVSNRALLVEGALQIGAANLDGWATAPKGAILSSVIRFPPADEIYFAVVVKHDCDKLFQRLTRMKQLGSFLKEHPELEYRRNTGSRGASGQKNPKSTQERQQFLIEDASEEYEYNIGSNNEEGIKSDELGDIKYRDRNNTVGIYLAEDGKIYMRNSGFWDSFPSDQTGLDPAVEVDQLLFAVYPPEPSVTRNLLVQEFIGYFVNLVGRNKVEEIQPWPDELNIPASMKRMPANIPLSEIAARIKSLGGFFTDRLLERYHAALNHLDHKHFVILTGLSGTGKTSLAKLYSFATHGIVNNDEEDPFFYICPVRPDWTDPTGLIGYYDIVSGKYIVTPFLEAVLMATAHRETPVFVCIDEMNIARAEFYFADVLSAMESRMPLPLHSNSVPLEGSWGEPVPDKIALPPNLFITSTINVDESTQPLSDKVLDRANTIDMSHIDVKGFLDSLGERYSELVSSIQACAPLLIQLNSYLLPCGLGFGYRVMEEIIRYIAFVQSKSVMEERVAIDSQVAQKILIKLKGSESQRKLLEQLAQLLNTYPDSLKIVNDLRNQLEEYGSFQNLR